MCDWCCGFIVLFSVCMDVVVLFVHLLFCCSLAACGPPLACQTSPTERVASNNPDPWRRTTRGWERVDRWQMPRPAPATAIHPLVIATLQLLVSIGALVAWPASIRPSNPSSSIKTDSQNRLCQKTGLTLSAGHGSHL